MPSDSNASCPHEDKLMKDRRDNIILSGRSLAVKVALLIMFAAVAGRLIQIQVIDSSAYQEIARQQYEDRMELPAARGSIQDRAGRVLVSSTMDISFGADPK